MRARDRREKKTRSERSQTLHEKSRPLEPYLALLQACLEKPPHVLRCHMRFTLVRLVGCVGVGT